MLRHRQIARWVANRADVERSPLILLVKICDRVSDHIIDITIVVGGAIVRVLGRVDARSLAAS